MSENLVKIEDLSVSFRTHHGKNVQAVDGISLELREHEVLAVVGESGSGKSVTAMSVLGLLPENAVASGSITFAGEELLGAPERLMQGVRGKRIAMIFQDPFSALDPVFTVGFQIRELLRHHFPKMSAGQRRRRTVELLGQVDIPDPERRAKSYPHELSGGQAQRVVVAMALACDPEVLIADEPTTALDVTVQAEILDLLMHVRDEAGVSVLIITHDMGVVADVADRVVVMREGHVVETRGVIELFSDPHEDYTRELLASVPRMEAAPRAAVGDTDTVLDISGLSVDYRRRFKSVRAVEAVDLSVRRGEVVALVGESGSGKSTIGKAITGLAPVSEGRILVDGVDAVRSGRGLLRELRQRIGVVFQNPMGALDPRFTVSEVVGEPLRVCRGLRGRDLDARVEELLESVRIDPAWANRYPHELSGGQRQRVAIARAIALDPVLLIADEPTSALDVSVQATILELFRSLQRERQFACLFISHDLAVVDSLADQIVVMNHAHVVERGDRERVLSSAEDPYTRTLIASSPVPDPAVQRRRRLERTGA